MFLEKVVWHSHRAGVKMLTAGPISQEQFGSCGAKQISTTKPEIYFGQRFTGVAAHVTHLYGCVLVCVIAW